MTIKITYDVNHNGDTTTSSDTQNDLTTDNTNYIYTVLSGDTFDKIIDAFVDLINAGSGDAHVLATANKGFSQIVLTARTPGEDGNTVGITATVSGGADITATTSGGNLVGGGDAAKIAPGTLVTLLHRWNPCPLEVRLPGADHRAGALGGAGHIEQQRVCEDRA